MALVRIEYHDGLEWKLRGEGETDATPDRVADEIMACTIYNPHRGYIDGKLVAETKRPYGRRGKTVLVRY